jgi:hypothetical protein
MKSVLLHPRFPNMSEIGRLRTALLELLTEHEYSQALPTSARFLFYELVQETASSLVVKLRQA